MSRTFFARLATLIATLALAAPVLAEEPDRRPPPAEPAPPAFAIDVPILVYHHVVPGHSPGPLFATPEGFEDQLKYLKDNGYQAISFHDLADSVEYGAALPDHPVILTFDDGWENQYAYAFPLLQKYGFTATFFVVTSYLDHQNFMTLDQLRTMLAAGMTIGDHTRSHPPLPSIGSGQRLGDEIAGSKAWLEQQLGIVVDAFAYPYGSYTPAVAAAVKAAGYRAARTVDGGTHITADNLETLPGMVFSAFISRNRVELAAGETRR